MGIRVSKDSIKQGKSAARRSLSKVKLPTKPQANRTTGRIPGTDDPNDISNRRTVLIRTADGAARKKMTRKIATAGDSSRTAKVRTANLSSARDRSQSDRSTAAPRPQQGTNMVPFIVGGCVLLLVVIIGIAAAASGNKRNRARGASTYYAGTGRSTASRQPYRPRGPTTNKIGGMSWEDWCKTTEGQNQQLQERRGRMRKPVKR